MKFWIHHKKQAAQVDKVRERRKLQRKLQHHQGQRTQRQNEERDEPLMWTIVYQIQGAQKCSKIQENNQWFDFVEEFWSLYDGSSDGCKRGSWHSLIIHTLQSFKTQGTDTCRKRKEKMKKPVHIGNWAPDETGWTTNHRFWYGSSNKEPQSKNPTRHDFLNPHCYGCCGMFLQRTYSRLGKASSDVEDPMYWTLLLKFLHKMEICVYLIMSEC